MPSFSALCADLDCRLTNFRDRWSGYNSQKKRGVFTVWENHFDKVTGRYDFGAIDSTDTRVGSREMREHIDRVRSDGAEAFGILCEPKNPNATVWSRKNFNSESLLALRFVIEKKHYIAYAIGVVLVNAVKSGRVFASIRHKTDSIDDLESDPSGTEAPDRVAGTSSALLETQKFEMLLFDVQRVLANTVDKQASKLRVADAI